jgi:MFS family permease
VDGSGPVLGKLADSTGPRVSLTLAFVFLLTGYLGIKAVYDSSGDNVEADSGGKLLALILFELLSGIGSDAGFCASLNAVVRSFPDKIVSLISGFMALADHSDIENDCDRITLFRFRAVGLSFFYDRSCLLSR